MKGEGAMMAASQGFKIQQRAQFPVNVVNTFNLTYK